MTLIERFVPHGHDAPPPPVTPGGEPPWPASREQAHPAPDVAASGRLSLALQGGGAFGAFTWGVLDRLFEDQAPDVEAISGTSAGAVNAVLVADGLRRGGPASVRANLDRFWTALADSAPRSFVSAQRATLALDVSTRFLSPYQLNPFNLNPLRTILGEIVDFEALRADPPVGLLIAATRIGDGHLRLFREREITLDAVMASACLPLLHHAVEIDGESYWDGGYAANPPIIQLVEEFRAQQILIVQIIPSSGADHPTTSPHIVKRLNQITFNSPLQHELESIETLRRILERDGDDSEIARRMARLSLRHIVADDWHPDLRERSVLDLDRSFLLGLRDSGRAAAASNA